MRRTTCYVHCATYSDAPMQRVTYNTQGRTVLHPARRDDLLLRGARCNVRRSASHAACKTARCIMRRAACRATQRARRRRGQAREYPPCWLPRWLSRCHGPTCGTPAPSARQQAACRPGAGRSLTASPTRHLALGRRDVVRVRLPRAADVLALGLLNRHLRKHCEYGTLWYPQVLRGAPR